MKYTESNLIEGFFEFSSENKKNEAINVLKRLNMLSVDEESQIYKFNLTADSKSSLTPIDPQPIGYEEDNTIWIPLAKYPILTAEMHELFTLSKEYRVFYCNIINGFSMGYFDSKVGAKYLETNEVRELIEDIGVPYNVAIKSLIGTLTDFDLKKYSLKLEETNLAVINNLFQTLRTLNEKA